MRKLSILLIIAALISMASCNNDKNIGDNPFFTEWDTPFGIPPFHEIMPEHYRPAFDKAVEIHLEEIETIVSDKDAPTFDNVILALDKSGGELTRIMTIMSLLGSADSDDALRAVRQEISPLYSKHNDDIYLNEGLFEKVNEVYRKRHSARLDAMQIRLTEKTYDYFKKAGATLSEQGKDALRKINEELSIAQLRFGENLLKANKDFIMVIDTADVEGLPISIRDAAAIAAENAGQKGKFAFTLSKPSWIPFLTNSDRRDLRETLYKGYLNRCNYDAPSDNRELINEIIRLRTEKAKLLGYPTHTHYVLEDRMAESPADVYALLDDLWQPALNSASAELEEMRKIKQLETGSDDFESWDWWYYAEKVRKEKYALNEEMLKPYFSVPRVQAGIFELCNRLYGLTFRPLNNMPVYNKDCVTYEVLDKDNSHLGILIMDFYVREGRKSGGAWCGSYRSRTYDNGEKTDPIVTIVCNFPQPVGKRPSLLSLDDTQTFFHEFGHAVHALMTDVPYRGLIRVERDFVELPSQIMENWAFEPKLLSKYAMHFSSNEIIPEGLIEKISKSSHFNQGFALTEFLAAAYIDMDIHTMDEYAQIDVNEYEKEMLFEKRGLMPQIEPRYRYPYFSHIFSGGYSAGYYSYLWAELLDKDAFEAFVETGDVFNSTIADSFRKNILNKGGSLDGMTLYTNFRGKEAAREPLLYGRGLMERPAKPKGDILYMPEETLEADSIDIDTPIQDGIAE